MKYVKNVKTLAMFAVAAAALAAATGSASATLTSPTGTAYTGAISATSTNSHFTGTVKIACNHGVIEGSATGGGTKLSSIANLTLASCNPDTVTVVKKGVLVINEGSNGIISSGAEITVVTHKTVFGIPVTSHCIYATEPTGTPIGTITDTHVTGGNAILHINGEIPRVKTDEACGLDPAIWTGTYAVTKPSTLYVD